MYLLDTVRMHRQSDELQAHAIKEKLPAECHRLIFAGHDAFAKRQAHVATMEDVQHVFAPHGLMLTRAFIQRKPGWAMVQRALTKRQPDGTTGTPELLICDTPGNRWAIERLLELTPDATDPDDVLKVDANDDGEGGDDVGDCLRYGVCRTGVSHVPAEEAVKRDDRAPLYDWKAGKLQHVTSEKLMEKVLASENGRRVTPRHRVPRR